MESHLGNDRGTKTWESDGRKDMRGEAMRSLAGKVRWDGGWQRVVLSLTMGQHSLSNINTAIKVTVA